MMMYVMFRLWRYYHHVTCVLWWRRGWVACAHEKRPARWPASDGGAPGSGLVDRRFRLQNLAAAIHAAFEVDVVRTAQFARILVLDIGRRFEGVGGAAHAAARGRGFASGDGHRSRLRSRREQSRRTTP